MDCNRDTCLKQYNEGCSTCESAVLTPREAMEQIIAEDCAEWCGVYIATAQEKCMRCRWGIAIKALQEPKWTVIYKDKEDGLLGGIPEDGQDVIVSYGTRVWQDTFFNDDGCYFDSGWDAVEGMAWRPMPEPYKKQIEE